MIFPKNLACFVVLLLQLAIAENGVAGAILPADPAVMLGLLPATTDEWKLTASRGYNELSGQPGLVSVATRDYQQQIPPTATPAPGAVRVIPATANLTLIDTAHNPEPSRLFPIIRQKESVRPDEKHYEIGGIPVMEETRQQQRTFIFDLNSRFLLVVTLTNSTDEITKAWMARLNLPALLEAAKNAGKKPVSNRVLDIAYVDEFNPKSNRVTQMNLPQD